MMKKLTAALLILILLFTGIPAVKAQALENEKVEFSCVSPFSEGYAWVRYEDKFADGLGVINEDFELIYAFNEEEAQNAFFREKGDRLDFEVYPFRDGIAYYQAEGYGYVIIDDEGEELTSGIWTAVNQPYIMARGEDYFMIREYDALDECWYVYAVNAHGKVKGKKVSYEDRPEYRYIGSGLYLGTGGEDEEVLFSEDEKKTFENDCFSSADFYGFSEDGEGFVFLDGDYDRAYMITEDDLSDEEDWEDWAEDPDWFDADETTVEFYDETVGEGKFYSAYDEAYINFEGETAVDIPDFGKYEPVSFGRFKDGIAPVLLVNNKGSYYVTYIDDWGDPVYEPVLLGKTEDGSEPVLTDEFFRTGYSENEDDGTTYVVYRDGMFSVEVDGTGLVVKADGGQIVVDKAFSIYGADENYYYLDDGVISLAEAKQINKAKVTEDTKEAELEWLMCANFAGIYDGSDGTVIVLLADGTGYYREPQSTTKEDLLQGVEITFEVSEGTLKIYNLAYVIYADVTGFEGSMLMLASDPGWHPEEFTRRSRDEEVPVTELLDPNAKLPAAPPVTPPGSDDPEPPKTDPGPTPHVDPYLYSMKHYSFRLPQHWVNRGCTVQVTGEDSLIVYYRGRWIMSLSVSDEYTGGDPAVFPIEYWTLADGNYVMMWVDNIAYDVVRMGGIYSSASFGGGPSFTADGDLEDFLYTVTGKDFPNIGEVKGQLTLETPELITDEMRKKIQEVTGAFSDFYDTYVIPAVTIY